MSRNRMKNSQSLHWMGVIKWVLITGMLSGLGLCYMLCKNQNLNLAAEASRLQTQLNGIQSRNDALALDLVGMKSSALLERRLAQMHSTLVKWNDPSANWVRLDQNTRAALVRMGTKPKSAPNLEDSTAAISTPTTPAVH